MSTSDAGTTVHGERSESNPSGLAVPAVVGVFSLLTLIGILTMDVPGEVDFPGPTFVPWILVVVGGGLTVLLTLHYLRHPDDKADSRFATYTDWTSVGWAIAGFAAFALLLELLGWILAAALLFWTVAHAFGSKRALFDLSVALLLSSAVYLIFGVLLGLQLPSGLLGGI